MRLTTGYSDQHRAAQGQAQLDGVSAVQVRPDRPVRRRNDVEDVERAGPRGIEQRVEQADGRRSGDEPFGIDHGLHQAHACIERTKARPAGVCQGLFQQICPRAASSTDLRQPLPQRLQVFVGTGPASPLVCRHARLVAVKVLDEAGASDPATPYRGVHKLQPATQLTPDHHEVRAAAGMANDDQRGQRSCFGLEQMLGGQHHLLRVDTELIGDCLDRVYRRAIDIGLTGLAQSSIADRNAKSFQQALQCRRSAVHRRDLDDLGHKKSARHRPAFTLQNRRDWPSPAARSPTRAGRRRGRRGRQVQSAPLRPLSRRRRRAA